MGAEWMRQTRGWLGLIGGYLRFNLRAQMAYRGAFLLQIGAMFLNDLAWVAFWVIFFERFPVLRGWQIQDVITLWAVAATGFGLAHALFGNARNLATLISEGALDGWMLYPRALLPHLLLGQMSATAWGDILFGIVVYLVAVRPDPARLLLFLVLVLFVATTILGFTILVNSLAFFFGRAATVADQLTAAMVTFSTYPSVLFDRSVRILLYTLIPAGFVSYLPVDALRSLSLRAATFTLAGALLFLALGSGLFYLGLRRYESGNLMEMRG